MGFNRKRRFSVEELQHLVQRVPAEDLWECAETTTTRLELRKRNLNQLPDLNELLAVRGVCVLDSIVAADFSLNHLASLNVRTMNNVLLWLMFVPCCCHYILGRRTLALSALFESILQPVHQHPNRKRSAFFPA